MKTLLKKLGHIALWGLGVIVVFTLCLWIFGAWYDEWSGWNTSLHVSDGYCNVAVVQVVGDIYTDEPSSDGYEYYAVANADDVVEMIRAAESDPGILGILVRIDSLGGTPVASELVTNALKQSSLPTVALIREYGTSGGYFVATGADTIFASPFSDVGGIGITMSYLENSVRNTNEGLRYVSLASAEFKDAGNPDKPISATERSLFERYLKIMHDEFVRQIAENRNLPLEVVAKLADGSSMPGSLALENGLVDTLGGQEDTRTWFAEKFDMPPSTVNFCE